MRERLRRFVIQRTGSSVGQKIPISGYCAGLGYLFNSPFKPGNMDSWKKRLGQRLRIVRQLRDMRQEDVCSDVGITQGTLSRYEHGKYDPTFYHIARFSRTYRWPLSGFDPDQPLGDPSGLLPPTPPNEPEA